MKCMVLIFGLSLLTGCINNGPIKRVNGGYTEIYEKTKITENTYRLRIRILVRYGFTLVSFYEVLVADLLSEAKRLCGEDYDLNIDKENDFWHALASTGKGPFHPYLPQTLTAEVTCP